jgi:peptidoglycan/LPS O-acetylase OafA/YrhL
VYFVSLKNLKRLCVAMIVSAIALRATGLLPLHNTLLQLDSLAAGAWLACQGSVSRTLRNIALPLACLLPLGLTPQSASLNAWSQTLQVLSGCAVLVLLLDDQNLLAGILRARPLRFMGMISYGVYLLHSFVFAAFLRTKYETALIQSASISKTILWLIPQYIAVVLLASASFFLFERPFLSMKRFFRPGTPASTEHAQPIITHPKSNPALEASCAK